GGVFDRQLVTLATAVLDDRAHDPADRRPDVVVAVLSGLADRVDATVSGEAERDGIAVTREPGAEERRELQSADLARAQQDLGAPERPCREDHVARRQPIDLVLQRCLLARRASKSDDPRIRRTLMPLERKDDGARVEAGPGGRLRPKGWRRHEGRRPAHLAASAVAGAAPSE